MFRLIFGVDIPLRNYPFPPPELDIFQEISTLTDSFVFLPGPGAIVPGGRGLPEVFYQR